MGFRVLGFGYCPHTVTVYNRATFEGLIYIYIYIYSYYEYYSTVTESGGSSQGVGFLNDLMFFGQGRGRGSGSRVPRGNLQLRA